ncbi:hypothetical protein ElyMa_002492700 [Elysia marginata]|uniref:Uncharacterized protein n=1 Tax=Elysia marginata TaxID=1093978 RepID=A0AAV4GRC2_9GAST|nr:hypothetical protein ElyMa_002492700 [Elysia marginata]
MEIVPHLRPDIRRSRVRLPATVCCICLGKAIYANFPQSKMGTQLQAILEFGICMCNNLHMGFKWPSNKLVCWGISGAALVSTVTLSDEATFPKRD